ncbi:hypothetical protein J4573_29200 [Actinomadura barringtoniae]|uniref:Uncharacterized protein n=1 Tax=Actinomadura barringtoniae TaxID=1427535 RepID=A0A939PFD8_9ACTN|nr:hypothetical protein [Actinomadura barringtoniae]MBO2451202.1 hypothetical protein [Actinomadura barringtoniae]
MDGVIPSPARRHAVIRERVHAMMTAAMRADGAAIDAFLERADGPWLDPHSIEFVREARRLVLASAAALTTVLGVHRPGDDPYGREICRACGIADCRLIKLITDVFAAYAVRPGEVDRAEAWRRAEQWFGEGPHRFPLAVDEFEQGFAFRQVSDADGPLLVVDRRTGALSRWPDLPRDELVEHYRCYLRREL